MEDRRQMCSDLRIGGQAVMEGVMMKGKEKYAVSVRKQDGSIITALFNSVSVTSKYRVLALPILRGVVRFVESMVIGMKTLTFSSDFFLEEDTKPEKKSGLGKWWQAHEAAITMGFSVILGVILALGLFIFLPALIVQPLVDLIHSRLLLSLLEGIIRVAIFIGYIAAISRMKDIHRVFEYHGAEHKCINCIEHGMVLNVENVRKSSKQHKRCGTSFLIIVMMISILFFMVIRVDGILLKIISRIVLIPVIAGVSYEFLRLAGRSDNPIVNFLSKPGLWMQNMTTKEPDDSMIEVGIASVEAVFDWKTYLKETFPDQYPEGSL